MFHCRCSKIRWQAVVSAMALLVLAGCHAGELQQDRSTVSGDIVSRFGAGLSTEMEPGQTQLPPGITTDDGMTEDEAVAIALWNNAAYQEMLAQLGVSHAQLLNAGLIADPQFQVFFPLGPKQLEFTTFQAVDALWLQPIRVKAAKLDVDQVTQSMVQNGLNVIRDARVAHANLVAASEQAEVAQEAARLRQQIADLARKRLDAGDISELEFTTSRIDALQARAAAERAEHDVTLARERLRMVTGLSRESSVQSREIVATVLPLDSQLWTRSMSSSTTRSRCGPICGQPRSRLKRPVSGRVWLAISS